MKFFKRFSTCMVFVLVVFCNMNQVHAGGGYDSGGNLISYHVNSITITNGNMDIKGWAYQENNLFDYVTKGTGYNQHCYQLVVGGKTYYDQKDFYVDHTNLNTIINQQTSSYKDVGFHFVVDLDDLYYSGNERFTLDLRIYHQNRSFQTISLSYLTTVDRISNNGYEIDFDTDSNPVSIYADIDNLYVNKTPTKGDCAYHDGYAAYFTKATAYNYSNGSLTGTTYYDSANKVYWYQVRYKIDKLDGYRLRVLPSSTGVIGWVCDPHVMYAGDPTILTLTKTTSTIQYETFSDSVFDTQIKTYGKSIELHANEPTLAGNVFDSWNTKSDGSGDTYYPGNMFDANEDVILYAIYTNEFPDIEGPILNVDDKDYDIPPQLDGNDLVIQLKDPFNPLDYVVAYDKEDGDITNKIKVESNLVPLDAKGNTTTAGTYEVVVSVTDLGGAKVSKKFVVIVNDPPIIEADERWFVSGWIVDYMNLMSKVKATDLEDGDLTSHVELVSIEYSDGEVDMNPYFFNTSLLDGVMTDRALITYRVQDQYGKETIESTYLNVFYDYSEYDDGRQIRYIDEVHLDTLDDDSIWLNNDAYNTLLVTSLNKTTNDTMYHFSFTKNDVYEIKSWLVTNNPSSISNQNFVYYLNNGVVDENNS